ncbi:MAG: nitrite/sulfite reductase [Sulfurimonas sp.]|jgi:ferredoxin-nitrite reductase
MSEEEVKLNKRERYKLRQRPYDYFEQFDTLNFESLSESDRYYLQDFGIFTTDFLEDEFTMRLRIPAGRLSAEQFLYMADVAVKYNLQLILTARSGIQLHGLEADNIAQIFKKMNTLGLTTWQSFGDNIRNIVTDVYDGIGIYCQIETYPIIMKMQEYILKNPRYVGMLPRRVSIGISGNSSNVSSFFANDIYFALAQKNAIFGFNVYMGGKNTEVAKDADIFLLQDEVFDFFKAFVEIFFIHGSRFSRSKNRLFYLIESIGMYVLKKLIEAEYKRPFEKKGVLLLEKKEFSQSEILKDGTYSFCYQTDFARVSADEIKKISNYATEHKAEIRIGIDQNIYLMGLKHADAPFESPKQSATILACAGNLCPYSFWSIKNETVYLPLELISKHRIEVGFSGCAKGCGRHHHTDIGLIGLKTNNFGDTEGGARVFIGAEHSNGASVGRMLFSMVPLVHLHSLLTLIIITYELSGFKDFEKFSKHVLNTYSEEFLGMWFLANIQTKQSLKLMPNETIYKSEKEKFENEKELLQNLFPQLEFLDMIDDSFFKATSALSKKLWTVDGKDPNYKPPIKRVAFR